MEHVEKKTEGLRVRVTQTERQMLEALCSKHSMSMSDLIRTLIFAKKFPAEPANKKEYLMYLKEMQLLKEEVRQFTQLNAGVANNLNQIAKSTHTADFDGLSAADRAALVALVNAYTESMQHLRSVVNTAWQLLK